jgi:hypothetical protein
MNSKGRSHDTFRIQEVLGADAHGGLFFCIRMLLSIGGNDADKGTRVKQIKYLNFKRALDKLDDGVR